MKGKSKNMNLIKALDMLSKGYKVRRKCWPKNSYFQLLDGEGEHECEFMDEDGTIRDISIMACKDLYVDEWEVYSVLDDVERKYLSIIIRPFREKVMGIARYEDKVSNKLAHVVILMKNETNIWFPWFDKETKMYQGMIDGKLYTLEELGL